MWRYLLLPLITVVFASNTARHGYRSSESWLNREYVVTSPTGVELMAKRELPESFDWRNVDGRSYVTANVNQHIPVYCGSCWIHGTVAALNDRIKIARKGAFPDFMLSRQAVMNCVPGKEPDKPPPGCDGGDSIMIHRYMVNNSMPDETCMPYTATNMGCSDLTVCRNCLPEGMLQYSPDGQYCFPVKSYTKFGVKEYGNVSGEEAMMKEIYARGPIACSAATDDQFMMNYSRNAARHDDVYVTDQNFTVDDIDHVVSVSGWGVTPSGTKYWLVRNSWGSYWGDMGWFKIRRGVNQMQIESGCDWAVPKFEGVDEALDGKVMGDYVRGETLRTELLAQVRLNDYSLWHLEHMAPMMLFALTLTVFFLWQGWCTNARSLQRSSFAPPLLENEC
eukprot:TRINITY_DN94760_c0_g1_i1.p1 TRINITY_DN94760_c0_g1~~TRINITY_DN94760_c0_g1_i1.p1  ORF type:complete len:392 (-),score=58.80 TRINITY_DN94760_c0_g1_i1:317-1492(-)